MSYQESIVCLKEALRRNKLVKDKELILLKKELMYELLNLYGEKKIIISDDNCCTLILDSNTLDIYLKDYKFYRCETKEIEKLENVPLDHLYTFLRAAKPDFLESYNIGYLAEICINFKLEFLNFLIKEKDNLIGKTTDILGINSSGKKILKDIRHDGKSIITFEYIREYYDYPSPETLDYDLSSVNEIDIENWINLIINNYDRNNSREISSPRIN